jgi:hypothetical protein
VRVDVGAVELADGDRWRCARVWEERRVGEEWRNALEKRGVSGTVQRGEAAAMTTEEERRGGDLGETAKC